MVKKVINEHENEYLKNEYARKRIIRGEILFTPLLVLFPIIVSIFLIIDWYTRGFSMNNPAFNGELILGIIILVGNIIFDIPFIKSLREATKKASAKIK